MAVRAVTITLRLTWWLRIYMSTLALLCYLTGMEPDMERVGYWIKKGIRIDATPVEARA
jgi:hypothetical protein